MHLPAGTSWRVVLVLLSVAVTVNADDGLAADDAKPAAEKPAALKSAPEKDVPDKVSQSFAKADRNGDRQLTLDEFLVDRNPANAAQRDFVLFDQDGDSRLNLDEFWSVPPAVNAEVRGPLPDPMQFLVDQVMSALDKSLDNWNENPDVEVPADAFRTAFWRRFEKFTTRTADREADPDGNLMVTRDEARRFLEIQFGVRRGDGKLLRLPTGRVVNYTLYMHVDLNKNDKLERSEFVERSYGDPKTIEKEFDTANVDGDFVLSFDEWCLVPWRGVNDPVLEFRAMDTNFDAYVDPGELKAGTPEWKHRITSSVFPGFDLNRDGKLSLPEYRLTMQANMVLNWATPISDSNGDGTLSFAEFKFESPSFPLLRMVYFRRLDLNSDETLDPTEFSFTLKVPDEFFVMNADGTGWKSFYKFDGRPACGSPCVSPNGKLIAFDAWPQMQQGGSALYVMPIDGGEPQQIALGMMPNWSGDGLKLACSRSEPVYGIWLLDLNGDNHKHIGPGWGAQLSPDGTKIAFTEGNTLMVHDLDSDKSEVILVGQANPYQQIFWNAAWSPDGKRLCFKGQKSTGVIEVATINMTGDMPTLKVHHSGTTAVNADFAWHPKGDRIIFSRYCPERTRVQMYEFNPDKNDPPVLVRGQDEKRNNTDMCWTPDGKRLIIVSGDY